MRGLWALLEEDTDASRAALREWLPPPAELLRIAEYECAFRGQACGCAHPSLLCARLHGERLGGWAVAAEVAAGMVAIEAFQPLVRTEAYRLLGRARAECAGYVWLEMRALGDALRWCGDGDGEGLRVRLRGVVGRMAATVEVAARFHGGGIL